MKLGKGPLVLGAVGVVVAFGVVMVLVDKRSEDQGGVATTSLERAPTTRNNPLTPVGPSEASKRAVVNAEQAAAAQAKSGTYQAPPVIVATEPPRKTEVPPEFTPQLGREQVPLPRPLGQPTVAPPATFGTPTIIYAYPQPLADQDIRKQVESQILAIMKPPEGGFVSRPFAKPQVQAAAAGGVGAGGAGMSGGSSSETILAARSGDVAWATLDRGFNSTDPQAPIFATIFDYRDGQATGPLHGARVLGQITYNKDQAAVTFNSLILPSGYQIPIRGLGITDADGRTGIAAQVDYHTLERYSGLLVAGLIQGAGQVGQEMVSNNSSYYVTSSGAYMQVPSTPTLLEAGMAALQPVGQALSSAASQVFSKPATISSPRGMGLGIVFIQPVTVPIEQVIRSAALTRAAEGERK
ncbi:MULTISPECIES: DotG/IcmE/VirB10 family protein [unclassified Xanthobacter]|uniref:DotG/IcmE/VirB10 family protein n=1 Tax=unclassified Xanthobacter TaxID=2623496 RepID=UPI001F4276B1|nr:MULTISPECIES: TrbI/VirB10 family protein [unclassified Xanthobacter]